MQLPPPDPDTLFADLLQDLPPETIAMAYEFKAFTRARKIKTPQQLLRAVLLYCALDQSLREVAGTLNLLGPSITDSSVAARLSACRPWVKALLPKMLATAQGATVPRSRRWIVVDGSTVQGPGAKGIDYRLHIGMDLVSLAVTHLLISDVKTGESLRHFAFGPEQVALADRGYSHPQTVAETVEAGADVVVRLNPHNMPLYDADGIPLDVLEVLQNQAPTTMSTVPVWVGPATQRVPGWLHGKLLYALLVDRRMRRTLGDQWGRLDGHRSATWWRPWKLLHQALVPLITGSLGWAESRWSRSLAVVAERPRQRQLQRLPDGLWWPQRAVETDLEVFEDDVWEEPMAA